MAGNAEEEAGGNVFANDGSFMEMFRRLQKQQKAAPAKQSEPLSEQRDVGDERSASAGATSSESRGTGGARTRPTRKFSEEKQIYEREKEEVEEERREELEKPKSSQGVMLGKRKALMKSIELREKRKRRREELEQEQQLAQEQDMDGKSSAWKAYMAQVKAYEARNCTEQDGYKRPLVK